MAEYIGRDAVAPEIDEEIEFPTMEATCGDCIHVEVCERNPLLTEFSRENPAYCVDFQHAEDVVEIGGCQGCIYSDRKRHQKCSCCRRNRFLKDCYEEGEGNG